MRPLQNDNQHCSKYSNNTKATSDTNVEYKVLYYQRKHKKHTDKGVSKLDGRLTVHQNRIISLYNDQDAVVYSKNVPLNPQWNEETIVPLGPWNVQIIDASCCNSNNTHATMTHTNTHQTNESNANRNTKKFISKNTTNTFKVIKRSRGLLANKTNQPPSKKPLLVSTNTTTSTILSHIPLPNHIRNALLPHQIKGVDFIHQALRNYHGALCADEMGLGKTLQAIAIVAALHRNDRNKHFVVVCPSSLVANWAREFDKWIGKVSQPKRVVVPSGPDALSILRSFVWRTNNNNTTTTGQVLILSYDLFRIHSATAFQQNLTAQEDEPTIALLVLDEAHRLKNSTTQTLQALQALPTQARLLLTATPVQNRLREFQNLLNFCCPQLESNSWQNVMDKVVLRRLQKDVLQDLPSLSQVWIFCAPTVMQRRIYQQIAASAPPDNVLTVLIKLRQLCTHPTMIEPAHTKIEYSNKLLVLQTLLTSIRKHAPEDKVVLVSNFTSVLDVIESLLLQPNSMPYNRLDGSTTNRQSVVDHFQRTTADKVFCLLLSSKAGGCGLNLISANRLIMVDADWNPALDKQAMGRIHRPGQKKQCIIYRLFTSGTIEEVILQRQVHKDQLASSTVDKVSQPENSSLTSQEIGECLRLQDGCVFAQAFACNENNANTSYDGSDVPLRSMMESRLDEKTIDYVHVVTADTPLLACEELRSDPLNDNFEGNDVKSLYDSDEYNVAEF